MEISAEDPVVADLRVLADRGVAVDTLRGCQALVQLICSERLTDLKNVNGKGCDLLLQKVEQIVSRVALGARKQAYEARNRVKKGRMPAACQAAALTELLKIPVDDDSGYFELMAESLDDRLWSARKDLAEKHNNAGQFTARAVEVRMGVWLGGQSDRTVRQKETRTDCFVGFANIISSEVASLATAEQAEIKELCRQLRKADEVSSAPKNISMQANPQAPLAPTPARELTTELRQAKTLMSRFIEKITREERKVLRLDRPPVLEIKCADLSHLTGDHLANITGIRGANHASELRVYDSAWQAFLATPSRRLVLIGMPASGKTCLLLDFTRSVLASDAVDAVPVVLHCDLWTGKDSFEDWVVEQVSGCIRSSSSSAVVDAKLLASRLINDGHLLLIFDGFDQIGPQMRADVIRLINSSYDTRSGVVVSCRLEEYNKSFSQGNGVTAAAVIGAMAPSIENVAEYLSLTALPTGFADSDATKRVDKWAPVFERLRRSPEDPACNNLQMLFRTPRTVALARAVYSDTRNDPMELLTQPTRFPDVIAMSNHLLDSLVGSRYPEPVRGMKRVVGKPIKPDEMRQALTCLAVFFRSKPARAVGLWGLGNSENLNVVIRHLRLPSLLFSMFILANVIVIVWPVKPLEGVAGDILLSFLGLLVAGFLLLGLCMHVLGLPAGWLSPLFIWYAAENAYAQTILRRDGDLYRFRDPSLQDRLVYHALTSRVRCGRYRTMWEAGERIGKDLFTQCRYEESDELLKSSLILQTTPPWLRSRPDKAKVKYSIERSDRSTRHDAIGWGSSSIELFARNKSSGI